MPSYGLGKVHFADSSLRVVLRAGAAFETGLKRVLPDCRTGRLLIQSNVRTGEPELHYLKLPENIGSHDSVLILDPQVSRPNIPHATIVPRFCPLPERERHSWCQPFHSSTIGDKANIGNHR